MNNFDNFVNQQLKNEKIAEEYYKIKPHFDLANQILYLRKFRNLSQIELAEKAGTTQAVISRIENTSANASIATIAKIASALNSIVEINMTPIEEYKRSTFNENLCNESLNNFYFVFNHKVSSNILKFDLPNNMNKKSIKMKRAKQLECA